MEFIDINSSVSAISHYIEHSPRAYLSHRKKNQRVDLKGDNSICYIKKGRVSVYRSDNHLLVVTLDAPAILGLAAGDGEIRKLYFRCEVECDIWAVDAHSATNLICAGELWKHAYTILSWNLNQYLHREALINHRCSYDMINEHLKLIWSMGPDIRERTSVYTYIMSRNHISRSGIHKVLHQMTSAGLVEIKRGKLSFYREGAGSTC